MAEGISVAEIDGTRSMLCPSDAEYHLRCSGGVSSSLVGTGVELISWQSATQRKGGTGWVTISTPA